MPHLKHLSYIDGLRAIAVLLVVGFHAAPNKIVGGFIGVDIFFMISGFLITKIISDNLTTNTFHFLDFYSRRTRRIFPALILVLSSSIALGWIILLPFEYKEMGKQVVSASSFISNFIFQNESGYFDTASEKKSLLHLWSLSVEIQFYLIWPLLMVAASKVKLPVRILIIAVAISSFIVNIALAKLDIAADFYSPFSRLWEFLVGGLLATQIQFSQGKKFLPFEKCIKECIPLLGLLILIFSTFLIKKSELFPGYWVLLPIIGTYLIFLGTEQAYFNRQILACPPLVFIGKISYPLYLWHWVILYFIAITNHNAPPLQIKLLGIATSFLLACFTYYAVEKPIQKNNSKTRVTFLLSFTMGLIFISGALIYKNNGFPTKVNLSLQKIENASLEWSYPKYLKKGFFEGQEFYFRNTGSAHTTLFIGDSSIEQYLPRINALIDNKGNKTNNVIFFTHGGCPPIPFVKADYGNVSCEIPQKALLYLQQHPKIDTVVIGGAWPIYLSDHYNYFFSINGTKERIAESSHGYELAIGSLKNYLQKVHLPNTKVYLMLYIPFGEQFDPINQIERSPLAYSAAFSISTKSFPLTEIMNQLHYNKTQSDLMAVAQQSHIEVINPFDYICKNGLCPALSNDETPIFKDLGHLSSEFVKTHATYVDQTVLH